ncbi:MAG: PQQ-binding-like beta-propeller repeat protein [Candidatus Thermoplasmatota archaeon]
MNKQWGKYIAVLISGAIILGLSVSSASTPPPMESQENKLDDIDDKAGRLSEGPWPSFGRNERNTRVSPYNTSHIDGTVNWTQNGGPALRSSPAIGSNGVMYFGSLDGTFYALDVEDGEELWTYDTGEPIISSPAVSEDETIYFGSGDNNIYALNPDGSLRWKYETNGQVYSSPTVDDDGNVYVGSYDHNLYSIDEDGNLNWKFTSDSWLWSSPAISEEGVVYVGSGDNNLYAIDKTIGTELWNYTTGGYIYSTPAVDEDKIYFGSYDGNLYALDAEGHLNWNFDCGGDIHSSPAIDENNTVYFGAGDGKVYAVEEGTEKWSFETGDMVESSPAVSADGHIYVGSNDNNIYALTPEGEKEWSHKTGRSIFSSPAIGEDGRIFVGSLDGTMYSFGGSKYDPELEIDTWREVRMSVRIAGRKGNSITAVLQENGEEIETIELTRKPGKPQVKTVEMKYRMNRNYTLDLYYDSENKGANPVWTTFTTRDNCKTLFNIFHHCSDHEVSYDINEEIGDMVSEVRELHFSVVGDFDPGIVSSYEWDFGDGNTSKGRNTSHEYSSPGLYNITLTVTLKNGKVIVIEDTVEIENGSSGGIGPPGIDPPRRGPPARSGERTRILYNLQYRKLKRRGKRRILSETF